MQERTFFSPIVVNNPSDTCVLCSKFVVPIIIVVIIMWTSEKPSQKNNSDFTVIWVSDWFKWVNFMQNPEHDVTVSYTVSQLASNERHLSVFCCFLFAVFNDC